MTSQPDPNLARIHDQHIDAYAEGNQDPPERDDEPPWVDDDEREEVEDLQ